MSIYPKRISSEENLIIHLRFSNKSKKIKTESTHERSDSRVSDMSLESADAINSINSALMEHEE